MFFLVFEGLDGSGKSSLMQMLNEHLKSHAISSLMTREPGGTQIGDQLRDIILQKNTEAPCAKTELLLYQASRAQHVALVIKPALDNKQWVLCDRYTASSIAFQGGGRGVSTAEVEWLNRFSTNELKPELTVLLDLSVEESKRRQNQRNEKTGSQEDRIESEKSDFHERVRTSFLKQAQQDPECWLILNAALSPQELFQILLQELKRRKWLL